MTHFDIFLSSLATFAFDVSLSLVSIISLGVISLEFNTGAALFQNTENFDPESVPLSQVVLFSTSYTKSITTQTY